MGENEYALENVKEKLKRFITANGKYRFASHAYEVNASEHYDWKNEESKKKFKQLGDLSSRLFIEAYEETRDNNIMKKVNDALETGGKKRVRIIPFDADNHFERGRALWISKNDEIKKQAAQEFEKASEEPTRNSEWTKKELTYLAAEAYGRLEMFDEEIRLHEKIKEMK